MQPHSLEHSGKQPVSDPRGKNIDGFDDRFNPQLERIAKHMLPRDAAGTEFLNSDLRALKANGVTVDKCLALVLSI